MFGRQTLRVFLTSKLFRNNVCFLMGILSCHTLLIIASSESRSNTSPTTVIQPISTRSSGRRILCWASTTSTDRLRSILIKETWGKRCDKLLFISSNPDDSLPTVVIEYKNEWDKTRQALKYIYKNHFNEADWFFKADDDAYVIMENMRHMLSSYNPDEPIQLGYTKKYHQHELSPNQKTNNGRPLLVSEGPGYVLSKEALRRIHDDTSLCYSDDHQEEDNLFLGSCLAKLNVIAEDTRDGNGRERFIPYPLGTCPGVRNKNEGNDRVFYPPLRKDTDCCSPWAVAFYATDDYDLKAYEYLIYKLKVS